MRIWVTRTEPQAAETARRLRDLGHDPVVAPVLAVRALDAAIDLTGVTALAFTSRNGVDAFADRESRRDLPVFVVGAGTEAQARAAGFEQVRSAEGDVESLGRLIEAAQPGLVLHAAAAEPAGVLAAAGVTVRTVPVYETIETLAAAPPGVEAVLIHSPRAAKAVAKSVDPGLANRLEAFAISTAAAAPILHSNFRRVAVAPYPNESALLKLLAV